MKRPGGRCGRGSSAAHLRGGLWGASLLAACAAPAAPAQAPPAAAPAITPSQTAPQKRAPQPAPFGPTSAFPVPAGEPAFIPVRSQRFQVSIPLPDRRGWELDRDGSSFLVMRHAATGSSLIVRRWREQLPMNRERCEEAARLIRELPHRSGELLDSRYLDVPAGYDTRVDVGASATDSAVRGWLLAFGASGRKCFAFVFSTDSPAGPGAEERVSDRLAVMQTMALGRVRLHRDTDIDPAR